MLARVFQGTGKRRLVAVSLSTLGLGALVAVLAVTFAMFNARTAFGSGTGGGCAPTNGVACTTKGTQAFADFGSVSSDGCIFTDANVQPFQSVTTPGHASTQSVFVFISVWDECNGIPLVEASNSDPNTGATVFNGTFTFDSKLSAATVSGTAAMFDWVSQTSFTSTINVTWTGFGPTSTFSDSNQFRSPGFFMKSHFKGVSRQAEASGTLTDASNNNLAASPSFNASLNNSSGGTVQIIKL